MKADFNQLLCFMSITPWKQQQLPARRSCCLFRDGVLRIPALKPGWSSAEWRLINSTHRPSVSFVLCQWTSTSTLKHHHHPPITTKFDTLLLETPLTHSFLPVITLLVDFLGSYNGNEFYSTWNSSTYQIKEHACATWHYLACVTLLGVLPLR